VGRLGLGSGLRVMGRLGSGVRVSASFQMFALTAGREIVRRGNVPHSGRDVNRRYSPLFA